MLDQRYTGKDTLHIRHDEGLFLRQTLSGYEQLQSGFQPLRLIFPTVVCFDFFKLA